MAANVWKKSSKLLKCQLLWKQCPKGKLCGTVFPWWRHQMEPFSALLALCAGNSPVPVNSPYKGQWCGALMFSLICAWINDWVNNREAGDLRQPPIVIMTWSLWCQCNANRSFHAKRNTPQHLCHSWVSVVGTYQVRKETIEHVEYDMSSNNKFYLVPVD